MFQGGADSERARVRALVVYDVIAIVGALCLIEIFVCLLSRELLLRSTPTLIFLGNLERFAP